MLLLRTGVAAVYHSFLDCLLCFFVFREQLAVLVGDSNQFAECERLQQLAAAIAGTVDSRGKQLLDRCVGMSH